MNPARKPITIVAQRGSTKPAAGVMATKPATIPEAAPRALAFPILIYSAISQPMSPAPVATWVLVNARTAISSAASTLPALNPNHPNHKSPAPRRVRGRLWGIMSFPGNPLRALRTRAAANAAVPEAI